MINMAIDAMRFLIMLCVLGGMEIFGITEAKSLSRVGNGADFCCSVKIEHYPYQTVAEQMFSDIKLVNNWGQMGFKLSGCARRLQQSGRPG
jgi:hypothetical protein